MKFTDPLTLVTGKPGGGKTLLALTVLKVMQDSARARGEDMPVFQANVPGLKLPWPAVDPKEWATLPAGAVLLVDEAWQFFPVRGRGEPPAWIGELAKVRHYGIRVVLVVQDPMLMDVFVRRLVNRHFHVVRKFGTHFATVHEYVSGVHEQVSKSRGESVRHEWRYPKSTFDLYRSAEAHSVQARMPFKVWLLLALPFIVAGLAWWSWVGFLDPDRKLKPAGSPPPAAGPGAAHAGPGSAVGSAALTPAAYVDSHAPRVPGLAYTAPVYDEVTRPVQAPYPAACILSASVCKCFTQQGTRLEVPHQLCRDIALGGFFVAWQPPSPPAQASTHGAGGSVAAAQVPAPAHGFNSAHWRAPEADSGTVLQWPDGSPQRPARRASAPLP